MRILLIANPSVGTDKDKRAIIEHISSLIKKKGGSVDVTYTFKPGYGKKYSSLAAFEGYDAVYAAGGDGTVSDVASGLVNSDIPLGIIPLGTGNGFARGMNIPLKSKEFIKVLLEGNTSRIDVGKISGHNFFSTAGVGFDAIIADEFNTSKINERSMLGYAYFGFKNYFFKSSEELTLILDGKELKRNVFGITIANTSQYGGGAVIAPQANPCSGKLVAVLIPKINFFHALTVLKKLFNGHVNDLKQLEFIEFKILKIKRNNPGLYQADGESHKGNIALNVSVAPSALTVIVP